MTWYEELGYKVNPLSIKPRLLIIGQNNLYKQLFLQIKKGGVIVLVGEYGSGKTAMLKKIKKALKVSVPVSFHSHNSGRLRLHEVLTKGFWIFKHKPKNQILLLDEVEHLASWDKNQIINAINQGYIKTVVLASMSKERLGFEKKDGFEICTFELKQLNSKESIELIRARMGNNYLSDEIIKKIRKVNPNTRTFLENCETVCRHAHSLKKNLVDKDDLEVLGSDRRGKLTHI